MYRATISVGAAPPRGLLLAVETSDLVYWLVLGIGVAGIVVGLIFVWFKRGGDGGGEGSFLGISFKAASTTALVLLLSALAIGWSARNLTDSDSSLLADAVLFGKVKSIEQSPPNPIRGVNDTKEEALQAILRWFAEFADARIVIDRGSQDGIHKGDWFATVSDPDRAEGLPKAAAGNLQDDLTALVRVVSVYSEESVSTLEEWAYDAHLRKVGDLPIPRGQEIELTQRGPVVVGQTVAAVPREEKRAKDQVDRWFRRAAEAPKVQQEVLYEQAQLRAADFLQSYPQGFFAGDVLWTNAAAKFELGRYRSAIRSWERFREEFPFHPSYHAAEGRIRRSQKRLDAATGS